MSELIKVASFNCFGLKSGCEEYVANLCKKFSIVALQETWLYPWELNAPSSLGDHINSFSLSAVNVNDEIMLGRPYGGITFIWHKDLGTDVTIRQYNTNRILGLSVSINGSSVLFLNVYFPTNSGDNLDEFIVCHGQLASILESYSEDNICIIGDFNAPIDCNRFVELSEMMREYNVNFHDTVMLPPDTYTHVNNGNLAHSWLDHIALSSALAGTVNDCYTEPDVGCSDHCVIAIIFNIHKIQPMAMVQDRSNTEINWNFTNRELKTRFNSELDILLTNVPQRFLTANNANDIDLTGFHEFLCQNIIHTGRRVFGMKKNNRFNVPGWNDRAKYLNNEVRQAVFNWNIANRPRGGALAATMQRAKARFRHELKFLKQNEDQLRANALLLKLQSGRCNDFWKEIKSLNPKKESLPVTVDGISGEGNIAKLWGEHFKAIANSVTSETNKDYVKNIIDNTPVIGDPVTVQELAIIVKGLKSNKAVGNDGIPSEVYKNASARLLTLLSVFLSSCLLVTKLPAKIMHVVVIPLLKCKTKNPSDISNYRPIAIATAISKVLEQVILSRINQYLWTADSQFGFKGKTGTEMAIFALKQTVDYYQSKNSPVYLCFLDAKKAFDRVNHWTLFKVLIDRGTPLHLVKLLAFWFKEQEFIVKWGNSFSDSFHCINGIRQGGQLSPLLYNTYTDELNEQLQNAAVGCHIGGKCINSLSYADDMVLLTPTRTAMQQLLNICDRFAVPRDIIYNTSKTVCMLIEPKSTKCIFSTRLTLNDTQLEYVEDFKYLGHIISSDGRDDKDILKQFRRQNAVGNMIIRKFSFAPLEAKVQLFKSHCYPVYCNALWRNNFQYTLHRLEVSYSDTFKRLMNRPRYTSSTAVFAENNTNHLKVVLRKSAYSLLNRLQTSNNEIIAVICNSDALYQSKLFDRWQAMLYTG